MRLLLDTSVLGWVCHPRKHGEVRDWFQQALPVHDILVSEVADYELRRELLRIRAPRSIAHLDELGRELVYVETISEKRGVSIAETRIGVS